MTPDFDLEIRKRFAQPLAVESGEFPDISHIEARMLPICYESGLPSGHVSDAAHFLSVATDTFIKEVLSSVFSRTRSNGPGDSGTAGFGPGGAWVQTSQYRQQLAKEEEAALRGEITRDKSGLLPVEAKAAGERGPLGMADLRIGLAIGDTGMANFPVISRQITYGYTEGELEDWNDYTWVDGKERVVEVDDVEMGGTTNGTKAAAPPNGVGAGHGNAMDVDNDQFWDGAYDADADYLDSVLDSCLAAG